MGLALHLAPLMGDSSVMDKLKKLSLLAFIRPICYPREVFFPVFEYPCDPASSIYSSDVTQEKSPPPSLNSLLTQQDQSIHQAINKLDFVKLHRTNSKIAKRTDGDTSSSGR